MVIPYENCLDRPLEGPVNMEREQRGQFVLRRDPYLIRRTIFERDVSRDHRRRVELKLKDQRIADAFDGAFVDLT